MQWLNPAAAGCLGASGGALLRLVSTSSSSSISAGFLLVGYALSQALMWTFHNRALGELSLLRATSVTLASNACASACLGAALFQEPVTRKTVAGVGLLLGGSLLIVRGRESAPKKNKKAKQM